MNQSSSSGKYTLGELSNAVKDYFERNPEMSERIPSGNRLESDTNNPLVRLLADFRDGGMRSGGTLNPPAEEEQVIKSQTASTPKVISGKTRLLDQVRGGVPIGGKFEVTYKYAINDPSLVPDGKKPGEYGRLEPSSTNGTFKDAGLFELIGEPKVTVNRKKEIIEVEKTESYKVLDSACRGDSCAINFKIVVTDPVNTDRKDELRSTNAPTFRDNRPQYIPVRNVRKVERGR